MKLVRATVVLVLCLVSLAAQVDRAREHLAKVRELAVAKDPLAAAQRLRQADVCLSVVAAGADRDAVAAEIAALVVAVDPLLPRRRELERRLAGEFTALSNALLDAGCPRAAILMAEDAARFDEVLAGDAQSAAKASLRTVDAMAKATQTDAAFHVWFQTIRRFKIGKDGKKVDKVALPKVYAELHADIPRWLALRAKAAKELRALAAAYKSKGRLELAFEVVAIGYELHRDTVEKHYGQLRTAAAEQRAERRYQRFSKPHMDELRDNNRKLGGSKGWRIGPRVITAPKASTKTAMLISSKQLTGDYRIEVDMQFEAMLGVMQVVLAWRSEDDYCVLEFERPRRDHSLLRIVHVVRGSPNVLSETRAKQTMRDYFTVKGTVKAGRIKVSLGSASCRADSPIDTGGGVSFGFVRPALDRKPKEAKKHAAVRLRNLVITEL